MGREGNILKVRGLDVVDGTPLLDIKPYIPPAYEQRAVRIGWLEGKQGERSD
jgi:tRNA (adenine37-N6)-methyltransferase